MAADVTLASVIEFNMPGGLFSVQLLAENYLNIDFVDFRNALIPGTAGGPSDRPNSGYIYPRGNMN